MNTKNYLVYSMKMANQLMAQGFTLVETKPNRNNKTKLVFFFENTNDLQAAIANLKK